MDNRELVEVIKKDYRKAALPFSERVMLDFAVKLTAEPQSMTEADIDGLRKAGFDDEAIVEIVQVAAFFNYINRVADGLGIDPEPEWDSR